MRPLTPRSSLENLRKEAKRWLAAIRNHDESARARLRRSYPTAPTTPGLRDVQHALAREHGLESWSALKAALADRALAQRDRDQIVARFLEQACPDWRVGGPRQTMAHNAALRVLRRHPNIARANFYTAVVCGDVEHVQRLLRDQHSSSFSSSAARSRTTRRCFTTCTSTATSAGSSSSSTPAHLLSGAVPTGKILSGR